MFAYLRISRPVAQLFLALCLISAMVIVGLVATSTPTHVASVHSLAQIPMTLCVVTGAGCP